MKTRIEKSKDEGYFTNDILRALPAHSFVQVKAKMIERFRIEYDQSNEAIIETINANEYEFNSKGERI